MQAINQKNLIQYVNRDAVRQCFRHTRVLFGSFSMDPHRLQACARLIKVLHPKQYHHFPPCSVKETLPGTSHAGPRTIHPVTGRGDDQGCAAIASPLTIRTPAQAASTIPAPYHA